MWLREMSVPAQAGADFFWLMFLRWIRQVKKVLPRLGKLYVAVGTVDDCDQIRHEMCGAAQTGRHGVDTLDRSAS